MIEPVAYRGRVDLVTDKFQADSPVAFRYAFRPFRGKEVVLRIEEFKNTRSNRQNRAWWGIVIKHFMDYMGERDSLFVHGQVLEAIGHYEVKIVFGKEVKKVKRTHNLKTHEFNSLYSAAQELGAGLGIVIPDPDSSQAVAVMEIK